MIVYDYSAYSTALHEIVTLPMQAWPEYGEVQSHCDGAVLGKYDAFKQLCLWYHKLPLPNNPKEQLLTEMIRESYQKLRKLYQKQGRYSNSNIVQRV